MRILICGGRDFNDYRLLSRTLLSLFPPVTDDKDTWLPPNDTVIISGGARGADQLAIDWCIVNYVTADIYKADWKKYGKSAGPIRNFKMITHGNPDIVIAFEGGKGTAHMVKIARAAGVEVREIK